MFNRLIEIITGIAYDFLLLLGREVEISRRLGLFISDAFRAALISYWSYVESTSHASAGISHTAHISALQGASFHL